MDQVLGDERVARGFRVKFPEDVLQDNLAGQLWFGAEVITYFFKWNMNFRNILKYVSYYTLSTKFFYAKYFFKIFRHVILLAEVQ